MPISVPPFVALQTFPPPLKGNWNRKPQNSDNSPQDDMFVSFELDWPVGGAANGNAVQINLNQNSPVVLGQIAALVIDNSRCGSDVNFIFTDTGFEVTVDARDQVIVPVLTNSLTFYAVASQAIPGDITIVQACNTVPPPIAQFAGTAQQIAALGAIGFANGTLLVTPPVAGVTPSGTLLGWQFVLSAAAAAGSVSLGIQDGTAKQLWTAVINLAANQNLVITSPPGYSQRFTNGLIIGQAAVAGLAGGSLSPNLYYSKP